MIRDYSAEKLQELKGYVNSDMGLWEGMIDMAFDLVLTAEKIAGILDIKKTVAGIEG